MLFRCIAVLRRIASRFAIRILYRGSFAGDGDLRTKKEAEITHVYYLFKEQKAKLYLCRCVRVK